MPSGAWKIRFVPPPQKRAGSRGALFSGFALIFMAEPEDKTQLALTALMRGTGLPGAVKAGRLGG